MRAVAPGMFTCVVLASVAFAEKRGVVAPATIAPQGSGWYCWGVNNPYNPDDSTSGCTRDPDECAADLADMRSRNEQASLPVAAKDCSYQKNAAVYSFYNVMHDAYRVQIYGSMKECQTGRSLRVKTRREDDTNLSSCDLVGATGTSINRKLIPDGSGWHCLRFEDDGKAMLGGCSRDEATCTEAAAERSATCVDRKSAWARTESGKILVWGSWWLCNSKPSNASRCEEVL